MTPVRSVPGVSLLSLPTTTSARLPGSSMSSGEDSTSTPLVGWAGSTSVAHNFLPVPASSAYTVPPPPKYTVAPPSRRAGRHAADEVITP